MVAVYEARGASFAKRRETGAEPRVGKGFEALRESVAGHVLHGPGAAIFATFCATSATASFMANDFHELSPYVLIGNPLFRKIILSHSFPAASVFAAISTDL